jgi:hypothetical protein
MAIVRLSEDISVQFNGSETAGVISNPPIVNVATLDVSINTVALTQGVHYGVDPTTGEIDFSEGSAPYGAPLASDTVLVIYDTDSVVNVLVPPTGIRVEVRTGALDLFFFSLRDPDTAYNIYRSTESGGGSAGYTRVTPLPIDQPISVDEEVVRTEDSVDETGNIFFDPDSPEFLRRTTTTEDTIKFVETQKYSDTDLDPSQEYFYVITSVNTLTDEESFYSEEVSATPLAIPVNPPIPRVTKQDIIENFVQNWLEVDPEADLKPGSLIRDTIIEFPSRELERLYTMERFRLIQQSFITLLALDDPNGDGVSDPVEDVPDKRALREALDFNSDNATQEYIDAAFDNLATNNSTFRKANTKSKGTLTFYAETPFDQDIVIPLATVSGTLGANPVSVETLQSAVMFASIRDSYFNPATNRYEIDVPARAIVAGLAGNVGAGSIRQVISNTNTPVALKVTNAVDFIGGLDKETNRSLAERSILSFSGVDPGTNNGYKKTMREIQGVQSNSIVGAGNDIMLRDYDDVRMKHIGGKVDIYIRGDELAEVTEQFEVLFQQSVNIDSTTLNPVFFEIEIEDAELDPETNYVVRIDRVFNETKNVAYDLTNSYIKDFKTIVLDPTRPLNAANPITASPEDVIKVSYTTSRIISYIPTNQPIREISTTNTFETSGDNIFFIERFTPDLVQADLISKDASAIDLQVIDVDLDNSTNYITKVTRVFNETTGNNLDISGLVITNYDKVRLVPSVDPQSPNNPDNIRSTHKFSVEFVSSNIGEPEFKLLKDDDPLLDGNSVRSTANLLMYRNGNVNSEDTEGNQLIESETFELVASDRVKFKALDSSLAINPEIIIDTDGDEITTPPNYILRPLRVYNETKDVNYDLTNAKTVYDVGTDSHLIEVDLSIPYNDAIGTAQTDVVLLGYNTSLGSPNHEFVEEEENLVLSGSDEVPLTFSGVDETTIRVRRLDDTPFILDLDYTIIAGESFVDTGGLSVPTKLQRVPSGRISSTEELIVSYNRRVNIETNYLINRLVEISQEAIEDTRHATADVLIKEANPVRISLESYVKFEDGQDIEAGKLQVEASVASFLASLPHGTDVAQSDIIRAIDETDGVRYVEVPLQKMIKADGNQVIREKTPSAYAVVDEDVSTQAGAFNVDFFVSTLPIVRPSGQGAVSINPTEVTLTVNGNSVELESVDGHLGLVKLKTFDAVNETISSQADGQTVTFQSQRIPVVGPDGFPTTDPSEMTAYINGSAVDVVSLDGETGIFSINGVIDLVEVESLGQGDGVAGLFSVDLAPIVNKNGNVINTASLPSLLDSVETGKEFDFTSTVTTTATIDIGEQIVDDATGLPTTNIADVSVLVNAAPVAVSAVDGTNGIITLAAPYVFGDDVEVTYDAQTFKVYTIDTVTQVTTLKTPQVDFNIEGDDGDVVFAVGSVPTADEQVYMSYHRLVVPTLQQEIGTGDSSTEIFTVLHPWVVDVDGVPTNDPAEITVTVAGAEVPSTRYALNGTTGEIDFGSGTGVPFGAPAAGDVIRVTYKRLPNFLAGDTIELVYGYTDPPLSTDEVKITYNTNVWRPILLDETEDFAASGPSLTGEESFILSNTPISAFGPVRFNEQAFVTVQLSTDGGGTFPTTVSYGDYTVSGTSNTVTLLNDVTEAPVTHVRISYQRYEDINARSYRTIAAVLEQSTGFNGGDEFQFRAVYQESEELTFVNTIAEVNDASGQSHITEVDNIIYVRPKFNENVDPNTSGWYVTYIIEGEVGAKDITVQDLEYSALEEILVFEVTN